MDNLLETFHPNSALLGVLAFLSGWVWVDVILRKVLRKPQKPRPPFFVADVIAVPPDQVTELLRGNAALLTVEQARSLLAMLGPLGECGSSFLLRRLGIAQAHNPGKQFLVLIEP